MDHSRPTPLPTALALLADQWTVLREQYAFLLEVLLRLVADHPDLAPDVIQGAIQQAQETKRATSAFDQALGTLREQAQTVDDKPDSS